MGFDVGFVADIETVDVTERGESRVVRVVGGTDHVDVVRLHNHQVALHVFERSSVTEEVVAVVAVDALGLNLPAVDEDALVNDFNASCADEESDIFFAAGQREHIEIRDFVGPELDVFHGGDHDGALSVDGSGAFGNGASARRSELPRNVSCAGNVEFCGKVCIDKRVVERALHEDVADVNGFAEQEVNFTEDTGHTPHILVFEVGTVGPLENEDLDGILSVGKNIGHVDFGGEVGDLAVCNELIVDPYIERGVNAFEIEVRLLALHGSRNGEVADVEGAGIFVGNERRVNGNGVVDVGVIRNVVAASESHLPVHGNGHSVEAVLRFVDGGDAVEVREELELPLAAEGLEVAAGAAVNGLCSRFGSLCGLEGDEIRAGRFASDMQFLRILVIIGDIQRHGDSPLTKFFYDTL